MKCPNCKSKGIAPDGDYCFCPVGDELRAEDEASITRMLERYAFPSNDLPF